MQALMHTMGIEPWVLISQICAFIFVYFMLKKFLFSAIANMIDARNAEIAGNLEKAERDATLMEEARDEYERRIEEIEREARDRIQEATKQAHEASDQIIAEARERRDEMIDRARAEIEHEKEKALTEIRDRVAELAVLGAEHIIRRDLNDEMHRDLVERYIAEVEQTT